MSTFRQNVMSALLREAKQVGTLYHGTDIDSAASILSQNKLTGSIWIGSLSPGISTTRDKNLWFGAIQLILDGDKISNNHKVFPYSEKYIQTPDSEIHDESNYNMYNPPREPLIRRSKNWNDLRKGGEYEEVIQPNERSNGIWEMPVFPYLMGIAFKNKSSSYAGQKEMQELREILNKKLPGRHVPFYDEDFKEINI